MSRGSRGRGGHRAGMEELPEHKILPARGDGEMPTRKDTVPIGMAPTCRQGGQHHGRTSEFIPHPSSSSGAQSCPRHGGCSPDDVPVCTPSALLPAQLLPPASLPHAQTRPQKNHGRAAVGMPMGAGYLHHHEGFAVAAERVLQQVGQLGVAEGHVALPGAQGVNDVTQSREGLVDVLRLTEPAAFRARPPDTL